MGWLQFGNYTSILYLYLFRMRGWAVTMRSTGSRWSGWYERNWRGGSQMTQHLRWAIVWEHHWDWTGSLGRGAPGRPPRSQMALMGEEEMGLITSMCSTGFAVQSPSSQLHHCFPEWGHHPDLTTKGKLSGRWNKCSVHKAFWELCKHVPGPSHQHWDCWP